MHSNAPKANIMQLYVSLTSPYARKVRIVVIEKGLSERVEITPVNPWENPAELVEKNPLSQVPVLVLDDGEVVFDSRVICACLDQLSAQPQLIPLTAPERIRVMRMEALADGMTDAAVGTFVARKQRGDQPDTPEMTRQIDKILAALVVMQNGLADDRGQLSVGTIAYGTALSYLDLRYGELNWRTRVPDLARWFEEQDRRPAMRETIPVV